MVLVAEPPQVAPVIGVAAVSKADDVVDASGAFATTRLSADRLLGQDPSSYVGPPLRLVNVGVGGLVAAPVAPGVGSAARRTGQGMASVATVRTS